MISENYPLTLNISRLALEVTIIHGVNVQNGSISISNSNDDEYTPSVFSTFTYNTSGKIHTSPAGLGGYAQWKPISYQSAQRKSSSSQQVNVVTTAHVRECEVPQVPKGLASALFGSNVTSVGNVTRWFVVFGTPGDDTHVKPTYNTW